MAMAATVWGGNMLLMAVSAVSVLSALVYPIYHLARRLRKDELAYGLVLICALWSTAALEFFDLLARLDPYRLTYWKRYSLVVEGLLPPAWLMFSLVCARRLNPKSLPSHERLMLVLAFCFPAAAMYLQTMPVLYTPDFQSGMLLLEYPAYVFYVGIMVFMIVGLFNLEATLANAVHGPRWKVKFEILGAGFLLASLMFYYSQGLLYRTIDMGLTPVRTVALLLAVLLMAASHHREGERIRIVISSRLAYKSVVLFAVSLYLLVLGLMGEGLRYFGESFHKSLFGVLALLIGMALVVAMLSESIKRRIKVFLHQHFYENKYDYRVQWMQFTERLTASRTRSELYAAILSGFCDTFGLGRGVLFMRATGQDLYHPASTLETDEVEVVFSATDPLVAVMAERSWVVNLKDWRPSPTPELQRFLADNQIVLMVPLFVQDQVDGFITLGRPINPSEIYNWEDFDLMKAMARQASFALQSFNLSDQLARARDMEAMGKVSTFVAHDLKNLVYTLSLMSKNARAYISEPEFQADMLSSLDNTVAKMKILISRLKHLPEERMLKREPVDLMALAWETVKLVPNKSVSLQGASVVAEVDLDEVQKVVMNLVLNAVEATDGRGRVLVEVGAADMAYVRVTDDGCGISPEFIRNGLFEPFRTTKKKGLGIGLYQCKHIIHAHGGRIEVKSEAGRGSVFTAWLPLTESKAASRAA